MNDGIEYEPISTEGVSDNVSANAVIENLTKSGAVLGHTDAVLEQVSRTSKDEGLSLDDLKRGLGEHGVSVHDDPRNEPDFWHDGRDTHAKAFLETQQAQ